MLEEYNSNGELDEYFDEPPYQNELPFPDEPPYQNELPFPEDELPY